MARFLGALALACTALGAVGACIEQKYPGDEVMGSFEFTATPLSMTCVPALFPEIPDGGFPFEGTFSRVPDNTQVWLTLQGVNRAAEFDGQVASSTHAAGRLFERCECTTTEVRETLRVALLSQSQLDAVLQGPRRNPDGGDCPAFALDGGLPGVEDGVRLPETYEGSFDAVRACGELVDDILPGEGCACTACSVTYDVVGVSR